MKAKIIVLILLFASITSLSYAGEVGIVSPDSRHNPHRDGRAILPADLVAREDFVASEIDKKNALQILGGPIKEVKYNKDGTIDSVFYRNGTVAKYQNSFDEQGNLDACSITIGDITMVFKKVKAVDIEAKDIKDKDVYKGIPSYTVLYDQEKNEGDENAEKKRHDPGLRANPERGRPRHHLPSHVKPDSQMEKPIVIYCPVTKEGLEKIAREPIQFDVAEIKKAVSRASALKSEASKEYVKSTAEYYDRMEKELAQRGLLPGKQGGATEEDRRQIIDKAIKAVSSDASGVTERNGLINTEKVLRGKLVIRAKEIYDNKVAEAQKYIDNMIDRLMGSKLAIYLNVKKDKMDALINLPKEKK